MVKGTVQTPAEVRAAETPFGKAEEDLVRTLAASGAVPLSIQRKLFDRDLADPMLENNNNLREMSLYNLHPQSPK
jgi:hypothetical protein